jgi:hypothetical protein
MAKKKIIEGSLMSITLGIILVGAWRYMLIERHVTEKAFKERAETRKKGFPSLSELAHERQPGNSLQKRRPGEK